MSKSTNKRLSQTRNSNHMETSKSTINQSCQQKNPPVTKDIVLLNPEHSIKNLLELINKKEKINVLTKRVAFLEQVVRESQRLRATNTSKLLSK